MRYPALRARAAARVEPLEARQLLSLVPAAPAPISPTADARDPRHLSRLVPAPPAPLSPPAGPPTAPDEEGRQQDRNAEFTSIEEAVLVAPPGSTIIVYPGFYHEVVTVDKTLRLLGS